ncbi:MAG: hypothetical protein GY721_14615 [Deltaproteobacteria bacterium]|nr:hypothetical protein [Deltaproteobacteria bacterium]
MNLKYLKPYAGILAGVLVGFFHFNFFVTIALFLGAAFLYYGWTLKD